MSYYLKQPKLTDNMKIADILILYFLSCDLFICINGCVHKTFKFVCHDNNTNYVATVFGD